jgi:hypothetical protein
LTKEKLPTIKKSISLRKDVYDIAEEMADKYFQGNLSGFIAFAISAYKHGLTTVVHSEHPQAKETIDELSKKSTVKSKFIDDVMNFMDNQ